MSVETIPAWGPGSGPEAGLHLGRIDASHRDTLLARRAVSLDDRHVRGPEPCERTRRPCRSPSLPRAARPRAGRSGSPWRPARFGPGSARHDLEVDPTPVPSGAGRIRFRLRAQGTSRPSRRAGFREASRALPAAARAASPAASPEASRAPWAARPGSPARRIAHAGCGCAPCPRRSSRTAGRSASPCARRAASSSPLSSRLRATNASRPSLSSQLLRAGSCASRTALTRARLAVAVRQRLAGLALEKQLLAEAAADGLFVSVRSGGQPGGCRPGTARRPS